MKIAIFLAVISYVSCGKILGIFPFASQSHHILGSALLKELAARGHEVTMVSPYPLKEKIKNYNDVHLDKSVEHMQQAVKVMSNPNSTYYEKFTSIVSNLRESGKIILGNKNLQIFLKTKPKFDVTIHITGANEALLGLSHAINSTVINFCQVGITPVLAYTTSNPTPYAYVPHTNTGFIDNMSFLERVINTVFYVLTDLALHYIHIPYQQSLLSEYFPNAPPIEELIDNIDLTLVNSHIATEAARPYLPNLIQIGGFHLQEKTKTPNDVNKFLNGSKQGAILFSLGSNLKSSDLSKEILQAILATFKKIKYNVLWKFEGDLIDIPENVMISKWLPQRDVLGHSNIKAFITHGGLGSTVEAIYHGVPMICMPFFGDQEKNVAESVANSYGLHLPIKELTEETFTKAINEVIHNPVYKNNLVAKSDLYKNQEINPMDKAVYWVEHVMKHKGAKHMKSVGSQLPRYQLLLLDIVALVTLILLAIRVILVLIIKWRLGVYSKKDKVKTN